MTNSFGSPNLAKALTLPYSKRPSGVPAGLMYFVYRACRFWAIFSLCMGSAVIGFASAETRNIVAEGTSEMCWQRERAIEVARRDMTNDANAECRALGRGWRYGKQTFGGYEQCTRCGRSEEFRCTVKQSMHSCTSTVKEQAEAAQKLREEREAKKASERALAAEQAKKAALERTQRQPARSSSTVASDAGGQLPSARKDKGPGQSGNPLDLAYESRRGSASPSADGDVLSDSRNQRTTRLVEQDRQRTAAQTAARKHEAQSARMAEANAHCRTAEKDADECLVSACGAKPSESLCSQVQVGTTSCSAGTRCYVFPIFERQCTGSNPAYGKWLSCSANNANSCKPSHTSKICVQKRLRATQ